MTNQKRIELYMSQFGVSAEKAQLMIDDVDKADEERKLFCEEMQTKTKKNGKNKRIGHR